MLKHLVRENRVILVTFSHGTLPDAHQLECIESLGVRVHAIRLRPLSAGLLSIRTLWTRLPLEVAFYTRPAFRRLVDHLIATEHITVGIAFFMRTAEYLRGYNGLPKILIAEDCRVLYQSRSVEAVRSIPQRIVRWWETRKLRAYESAVVSDFNVTTVVSSHDMEAMARANSSASYAVVTNGVDLEKFSYNEDQHRRSGLLFCGKLDVQANHLMAMLIVAEIFPAIKAIDTSVHATIVGADPLAELVRAATGNVHLHRNVPDILPFYHNASVFVHPHHGGSGIQNKVLEAMASGCVVVTTPSGLQGIAAEHSVHCLVGNSTSEIVDHIVTLINNPDRRRQMATEARFLMERNHNWECIGQQLDTVLNRVVPTTPMATHESVVPR